MTEQQQVSQSIQLISSHFSIPENELMLDDMSLEALENKLTSIVKYLLDKDMNRLLHSLYRIDVNEGLVKNILTEEPPENLGRRIAQEIIKRELQKVETRARYSGF